MSKEFVLPDIGEGIVECELLSWLVSEGDKVVEDQPVAEVMTDKATVQIPAMDAGRIIKLHYRQGDIAKVHSPLYTIDTAVASKTSDSSEMANTPNSLPEQPASSETSTVEEVFKLPDIGEGIVECEIVKWHVEQGEPVAEDQVVLEVMTDKAVVEIPAKHDGVVTKLFYQQGDIAKVHSPLFSLTRPGQAVTQQPQNNLTEGDVSHDEVLPVQTDGEFVPAVATPGKVLASPAVRRIAREHEIDLASMTGSGKKGRILKQDILSVTAQPNEDRTQNVEHGALSDAHSGVKTVALRGVQAMMAKKMAESAHTIPHFTVSDEVEMDALITLRDALKPAFANQEVKLSFMPFFVKALSLALDAYPILNSQLSEDGQSVHFYEDHNIGFAIDSQVGLLVPNIKRVQDLSLLDIATQMQNTLVQGREGKLPADALKGGTITISNIGMLGGITATPIINKPEVAIVAIGKMQTLPRFDNHNGVVAKQILQVSWSADHRIIDGATMVKFNNLWCHYLQNPSEMLMYLR
ncbi:dihydrolipoyllysine-residue acetyltransferase [Alteromonas sp. 14N.309.X.WAT.G.H12]|uniref:dihydrolipoyllysine-residue acetyltransferase n=1 Tax=Alteromonas sp. 14N.309.X.WAT.G.H12 TaxID=3120824 RepID=UPI002FD71DFF